MKKMRMVLSKVILSIFLFLLGWILLNGLLNYDVIIYEFNRMILVISIIVYLVVLVWMYKKVLPKIIEKKFLPHLLMGIFFILCLIFAYFFRLHPTWDMGSVFMMAKNYVTSGHVLESYLYSYPNNTMLTLMYIAVFKIASIIPKVDYILVATLFNTCIITGCMILIYQIAKKILDKKKALMLLILTVFTSPLYMHAAIYYSDSISAFIALLIFYCYLVLMEKKQFKNTMMYQILLGIFIFLGIKIKITTGFVAIAIVVYHFLNGTIKENIKKVSIILPTLAVSLLIFEFIINPMVITNKKALDTHKVPIIHWMMMGLKQEGGYNEEDYAYTFSYLTYQDKKEADIKKIKQRISEYDANSFIKHLTSKLKFAWTDGTYYAPEKLRREPVQKNLLHEIVLPDGKYANIYKYIPQSMHMGMLILIVINVYQMVKYKKYQNKDMILAITMFGFMLFLLVWENRSRYIFTIVPLMMLLQMNGIEVLARGKKIGEKKNAI